MPLYGELQNLGFAPGQHPTFPGCRWSIGEPASSPGGIGENPHEIIGWGGRRDQAMNTPRAKVVDAVGIGLTRHQHDVLATIRLEQSPSRSHGQMNRIGVEQDDVGTQTQSSSHEFLGGGGFSDHIDSSRSQASGDSFPGEGCRSGHEHAYLEW